MKSKLSRIIVRASKQTAKVDSKQVKQNVAKKKTLINVPSCGRFKTPIICPIAAKAVLDQTPICDSLLK